MAKKKQKKRGMPPKELLIILVFFLSFAAWAFKQCSETKNELQAEDELENTEEVTTTSETATALAPTTTTPNTVLPPRTTVTRDPNVDLRTGQRSNSSLGGIDDLTTVETVKVTPLYVTIDGWNMRRGPSLDSAIIMRLGLFEEVGFMGEVSDSTEQISLGDEMANEPWIKIRHKGGRVGWVYGAGVNFYKRRKIVSPE